jgi:hypothetical protein
MEKSKGEEYIVATVATEHIDHLQALARKIGLETVEVKFAPSKQRGGKIDRSRVFARFVRNGSDTAKKA